MTVSAYSILPCSPCFSFRVRSTEDFPYVNNDQGFTALPAIYRRGELGKYLFLVFCQDVWRWVNHKGNPTLDGRPTDTSGADHACSIQKSVGARWTRTSLWSLGQTDMSGRLKAPYQRATSNFPCPYPW